jgi:molybdenum-dependent DNA-binding transcriptional regulator ModE
MAKRPAVSDKKIIRLYTETGSITRTAKRVKRAYFTIWARLNKLGLLK